MRRLWIAAGITLGCVVLLGAGWLVARSLHSGAITIRQQEETIQPLSTLAGSFQTPIAGRYVLEVHSDDAQVEASLGETGTKPASVPVAPGHPREIALDCGKDMRCEFLVVNGSDRPVRVRLHLQLR